MGVGGAFRAYLVLHLPEVLQLLISIFSITGLTRQRALAASRLTEHAAPPLAVALNQAVTRKTCVK